MTDADAVALFDKTLNPQTAFMQGKMKIKGNMAAAQKFTPDTFPQSSKLWKCIVIKNLNLLSIFMQDIKNL